MRDIGYRLLAGVWMTEELVQELILQTKESYNYMRRYSDEEIIVALDFTGLEPELAGQILDDCAIAIGGAQ